MTDQLDQILTDGLERIAERAVPDDGVVALPHGGPDAGSPRSTRRLAVAAAAVAAVFAGAVALAARIPAEDVSAGRDDVSAVRIDLPPIELARDAAGGVVGDHFVVWGGRTDLPSRKISTDVPPADGAGAVLDLRTLEWDTIPPPPLAARIGPASVVIGDRIYLLGGRIPGVGSASDGAVYDLSTGEWKRIADPPPGLCPSMAATMGGSIYAVGLCRGGDELPFAVYEPAADSWRELSPAPPVVGDLLVRGEELVLFDRGAADTGALWSPVDGRWHEVASFGEFTEPGITHSVVHASVGDGTIVAVAGTDRSPDEGWAIFSSQMDATGGWSSPRLLEFDEGSAGFPSGEQPGIVVGRRFVWHSGLGLSWFDLDTGEARETGRVVDGVPLERMEAVLVPLDDDRFLIYGGQLPLSDEGRTDTGPAIITLP